MFVSVCNIMKVSTLMEVLNLNFLHQFKVSVMEVQNPTVYDFRITFTELRLVPIHMDNLQLNGSREALLTDKQLLYQTQPLPTDSSKIVFQVCDLRCCKTDKLTPCTSPS
jgi:hypothetical protein